MEKKINNILKKIEKNDPEKMMRFIVFLLLFLVFIVTFSLWGFSRQIEGIKIGKDIPERNMAFENKLKDIVSGYPIEEMISQIADKDERLAAFLIAIAKKESNWGKRAPVLNGEDCYNYWGYRGIRDKMGSGGHTCFDSPRDAVSTVARRIGYFIDEKGLEDAEDMVVWKCGKNCDIDNNTSVKKWISDVDYYYGQVLN